MNIETINGGMKLSIVTEHFAARDVLLSQTNELKNMLMDQGVRLDKVEVQLSDNFDQSMANARQESQNAKGRRNRAGREFNMEGTESVDGDAGVKGMDADKIHNDGILDLVA